MRGPEEHSSVRGIGVVLAVVAVGSLAFLPFAPGAGAATSCEDTEYENAWFDGFIAEHTPVGVEGRIRNRNSSLCSPSSPGHSVSAAWLMLHGDNGQELAQVGYLQWSGMTGGPRYFTAYSRGEGDDFNTNFYPELNWTAGDAHDYTVELHGSQDRIEMFRGENLLAVTPWDPRVVWDSPWVAQMLGETHDAGDDMPGLSANRTDFRQLATKTCNTCSYVDPTVRRVVHDKPFYKFSWIQEPVSMEIWTHR